MIRAKDQLEDESSYRHLASFLRSGGTLEVGEDFSTGAFARLRKGNKALAVVTKHRDLAAILKEMDSKAKQYMKEQL
jgi:hypothetical protein